MASAAEWLRRARWAQRSKQFGKLAARIAANGKPIATMEFDLPVGDSAPLWDYWIKAVHHPAVIAAIEPGILRYAALDWSTRGVRVDSQDIDRKVATLGLELVAVIQRVVEEIGISAARWFTNPVIKLDLEGGLRVGFAKPLARLEMIQERAVIIAIGRGLDQLVSGAPRGSAVGKIMERCLDSSRADRFGTLRDVAKALRRAGGQPPRLHAQADLWDSIEQAIGFWGLRERRMALECLDPWVSLSATPILLELRELLAKSPLEDLEIVPTPWHGIPTFSTAPPVITEDPTSHVPVPRVFQNAYEVLHPKRAERRIEPAPPVTTPEQQTEDLLRRRLYREALDRVDVWLTTEPDEPRAHHVRGKALLALGRLPDARAAFDRACTLCPHLLAAMLLRREVDRVMAATQASVGIASAMSMSLPDHLAELRDVLVSGRIVDAIQLLRRPAYDDDVVAQLLLAELLCTDDRHDDALAIYDRLATDDARLAKARALVALDRPAEALQTLETLTADDAHELRSHALRALGRVDEAEVQLSMYLRLIEQRSDRRLGSR